MTNQSSVERGKHIVEELSKILREISDSEILELLGTGALDDLLSAILDPTETANYSNLHEFLFVKKGRATILAGLRNAITRTYAFLGTTEAGDKVYISPSDSQSFEDGVLFLQSENRFEGYLGLYRQDGSLSYAVAARGFRAGEQLSHTDFAFIDVAAFRERLDIASHSISLNDPITQLEVLLSNRDNDESHYQEFLINYPWILGADGEGN